MIKNDEKKKKMRKKKFFLCLSNYFFPAPKKGRSSELLSAEEPIDLFLRGRRIEMVGDHYKK